MRSVSVASDFYGWTGFGQLGEYAALGFKYQCGLDVIPYPLRVTEYLTEKYSWSTQLAIMFKRQFNNQSVPMYFYSNLCDWDEVSDHPRLFLGTMYESTVIPEDWVDILNKYPVTMVPTKFLVETFKNSGVKTQVEVIPDGYDPLLYQPYERKRKPFTTLIVGPVLERKNTKIAIEAWKKVFSDEPHARLIIKGSYKMDNYTPDDWRISFFDEPSAGKGILPYYLRADILLAVGSEGFGMPLLEGMATSMPVIAFDSEGQADVCEEAGDCLLTVKPVAKRKHSGKEYTVIGEHNIPSVDDIADRLQWIIDNPEQAYDMGKRAAEWAPLHRSIWYKIPKVYDLMERYGAWE